LDVDLDAVERKRPERVPQHELEPLGHEALPLMRDEGRIPEVRAPQVAEHDVPEARAPREGSVVVAADEVGLAHRADQHVAEVLGGLGQVRPGTVELPARSHGAQERLLVGRLHVTEEDLVAVSERPTSHRRNGTR
jgi:hypothetical protein